MPHMLFSDLLETLLNKRGLHTEKERQAFLSPDYDLHTHAPFLIEGMRSACDRILHAIEEQELIAVYSDFDCDGIPGAVVLHDLFKKAEYENVVVYIPHRDREGYGFHVKALEELALKGVKLIITVDVGTTAVDAVLAAQALGMDVIVTDHHEVPGALPACTVLNPRLGTYPFRDLCGAGMAFKLTQALLSEGKARAVSGFTAIADGWEKWLLDMVGIATIADMVPLIGENRVLAHYGLRVLRKSRRPGIRALIKRLRLRQGEITEQDIGFSIAPRINAASRMDLPELAFRLLITADDDEAEKLADELERLNSARKGVVGSVVREAKKRVRERFADTDRVVVLGSTEWKPALLGLAANSVVEERGGAVCLWGRDAEGRLKGSCRSDGTLSVVGLFTGAESVLEEYGGHAASGGFSVSHERVHELQDALAAAAEGAATGKEKVVPAVDSIVSVGEVSWTLYRELSQLAPFGVGNEKPLFRVTRASIYAVKSFGKEKNHIELTLRCAESGRELRAFDYFNTGEGFTLPPRAGVSCDVLCTIERDSFRGSQAVAARIVDVIPSA